MLRNDDVDATLTADAVEATLMKDAMDPNDTIPKTQRTALRDSVEPMLNILAQEAQL